jgi:hypothetical protein
MAITNTRNEVKHGNRTTRAKPTPASPRQPADAGADRRRDSSNRPKARATARPASDHRAAAGSRSEGNPIAELTIDIPDDDGRLIEVVADLLLDLVRQKHQRQQT